MQADAVCPTCSKTFRLPNASANLPQHAAASGWPAICEGSGQAPQAPEVVAGPGANTKPGNSIGNHVCG